MSNKRSPILGYVVSAREGLFHIAEGRSCKEDNGVLWFADGATVFKTRRAAKRAIANTKKYRDREWPDRTDMWPWIDKADIIAVRFAQGVK